MNIKRIIFLLIFSIAYLVLAFLKNEIINSFFAAILFIVFPFLIGEIYSTFISKKYFEDYFYKYFLFCWLIGALSIFLISLFLLILNIFNITLVLAIFVITLLASFMIKKEYPKLNFSILDIFISTISSAIFFIYFRFKSPAPFQSSWDIFMNNFIVERIINFNEFHIFTNKFSEINYLIKGNLSIFQDLIALICKATNCNPLYFYWAALFITGLVFSIGLITLFKELLPKDKFFAYIIPLFAFSIFMSHGSTSNLSWFLTSTIILMFSPFFLSWVISFDVSNKEEWVVFLLLLFILTLFHYYLGLIFGLILLFSIIISKYIKIKNYNIYLAIFSILVFIVSIFFLDKISGSFKIPFLPSDFKILKDKLTYLNLWTPLVILSLSLLGTIYLLIKNIKYPSNKINTFMTSFILFWGIFFLPLANIHRSGMFLYAFFAVVPFLFLCERLWINKVIKILIYSTIICLLFVSWIFATQNFLTTYSVQGVTSSFSNYDLDMGNWIKNNTSKDTIIIGESADQNIQSGISGRENVGGHQMADWRKSLLRSALIINDQKLVKNYICKIGEDMGKDRTIVIILSGRTFIFLNNDINSPIYLPTSITSKQIIDKFNNYSFIELKKQFSDQIYLFEVKCK